MIKILQAQTPEHLTAARQLFEEYAAWLEIDLSFQGFAAELATLPGRYAPPSGCLLLAQIENQIAGCAALRQFNFDACEMKRLFVREAFRGQAVGKQLVLEIIKQARLIGYKRMLLDTLPNKMPGATKLYRAQGFIEIPAYYENPLSGTVYFELDLHRERFIGGF